MGYYIGQFYFDKRELFLILAVVLLGIGIFSGYQVPFFKLSQLFVLSVILLLSKVIIPSSKDTGLFIAFIVSVIMTMFIPFFTVLFFFLLSLFLLKILRAA